MSASIYLDADSIGYFFIDLYFTPLREHSVANREW